MSTDETLDAAAERVLALIEDEVLAARYPNGTHFIAATNPAHGSMATEALFAGDPVALIYPGGQEVLFTPERAGRLVALVLHIESLLHRRAAGKLDTVIQLPHRTRIEARDAAGLPLAA